MRKLSITLAAMFLAFQAHAQQEGPNIKGDVNMQINASKNLNAAVGNETTASQAVGAIESGTIKGNTNMKINAVENLNAAVGNESCSDQQVGTIGKKSTCK